MAILARALRAAGFDPEILVTCEEPLEWIQPALDLFQLSPTTIFAPKPDEELSTSNPGELACELSRLLDTRKYQAIFVAGHSATARSLARLGTERERLVVQLDAGLFSARPEPHGFRAERAIVQKNALLHFAPSFRCARNAALLGADRSRVFVSGSLRLDALSFAEGYLRRIERDLMRGLPPHLRDFIESETFVYLDSSFLSQGMALGAEPVNAALGHLFKSEPKLRFLVPLSLQSPCLDTMQALLAPYANAIACEAMPYLSYVFMLSRARLCLTNDSLQMEEAATLGIPTVSSLVASARPELQEMGFVTCAGAGKMHLATRVRRALSNSPLNERTNNPYGDGNAASRIIRRITGVKISRGAILAGAIENSLKK